MRDLRYEPGEWHIETFFDPWLFGKTPHTEQKKWFKHWSVKESRSLQACMRKIGVTVSNHPRRLRNVRTRQIIMVPAGGWPSA